MWDKINLWQYQQIYNVLQSKDKEATELDINTRLVAIVNDMTEAQVDSLDLQEYVKLSKSIVFLSEPLQGKPVKYIPISKKKRYRLNYDISKMPFARYIESKVFSEDLYNNLHKLAATMVIPQRRNLLGVWIDIKYDASMHEQYANDMLGAKFVDVYHSLVFFYQVYRNWIEVSQDYLVNKMKMSGIQVEKAKEVVASLCNILDGNIAPNLLPTTKIAQFRKHMNKVQLNA
ncbi:hypothetical protein UFOVP19_51 [uncultured Caudovirales phage]|uniref:Uncharacterized protein n=1 Tax=uncultured Caudovirales phage TaxID=2100421 RepID=A0A6J5KLS3_9CAUD|nr:hypothetical protein UFOVP19_51 [uncultured Caudovirales phage]